MTCTKKLFLLIALPLEISCCTELYVNFDTSMGKDSAWYARYYKRCINSKDKARLDTLRTLYERNNLSKVTPQETPRIPKIIHQIWLGSQFPEQFKSFQQSWIKYHPDWEYTLWTDKDVEAFGLENRKLYDNATNYGERSDIARYEILYRYGGLYVDTDFQCLKPFDLLHHCYDFYTGIELPAMASWLGKIIIPNGLIGCIPGHPILKNCIQQIKYKTGTDTVRKTGPIPFGNSVLQLAGTSDTRDIAFPASFFYPIDKRFKSKKRWKEIVGSETFAVHHWAGSWSPRKKQSKK